MSERCTSCGSELFAGQQFCRRCGAAVRASGDERPTQILEGAATARPVSGEQRGAAGTDPFGEARPTSAQEPLRAFRETAPLAHSAQAQGRGKWWTLPFIFIVALACIGVLLYKRTTPRAVIIRKGGVADAGAVVPRLPPVPPEMLGEPRELTEDGNTVREPLGETDATVTGDRTVITKTFHLGEDATFSLPNAGGNVTIEGWDQDNAEIRIVKRGGSEQQRRALPFMLSRGENQVSLTSPAAGASGSAVKVSYEIKLPRSLRQLEIRAEESEVRLRNLDGGVLLDVKAGRVELTDVTGVVRSKLIKGTTKVSFESATHDGAQEYSVVRGNVEVDFSDEPSTDLKAETMDGSIEADESLGLRLVQNAAGRHALGRLGEGGDPLLIKVVNGDIKLKK